MNPVGLLEWGPFGVLEPRKHREGRSSGLLTCPGAAGELLPHEAGQ